MHVRTTLAFVVVVVAVVVASSSAVVDARRHAPPPTPTTPAPAQRPQRRDTSPQQKCEDECRLCYCQTTRDEDNDGARCGEGRRRRRRRRRDDERAAKPTTPLSEIDRAGMDKSEEDPSPLDFLTNRSSWATMDGFWTFASTCSWLCRLSCAYPELVDVQERGRTHERRALLSVKITAPLDRNDDDDDTGDADVQDAVRPGLLVTSMHHGNEPLTLSTSLAYMWYLCTQFDDGDTQVHALLRNRELYFVPVVNPDGLHYNTLHSTGDRMFRKNRADYDNESATCTNDTLRGVDLGRNFGIGRNQTPRQACDARYEGAKALDQPESLMFNDILSELTNVTAAVLLHAVGSTVFYPPMSPSVREGRAPFPETLPPGVEMQDGYGGLLGEDDDVFADLFELLHEDLDYYFSARERFFFFNASAPNNITDFGPPLLRTQFDGALADHLYFAHARKPDRANLYPLHVTLGSLPTDVPPPPAFPAAEHYWPTNASKIERLARDWETAFTKLAWAAGPFVRLMAAVDGFDDRTARPIEQTLGDDNSVRFFLRNDGLLPTENPIRWRCAFSESTFEDWSLSSEDVVDVVDANESRQRTNHSIAPMRTWPEPEDEPLRCVCPPPPTVMRRDESPTDADDSTPRVYFEIQSGDVRDHTFRYAIDVRGTPKQAWQLDPSASSSPVPSPTLSLSPSPSSSSSPSPSPKFHFEPVVVRPVGPHTSRARTRLYTASTTWAPDRTQPTDVTRPTLSEHELAVLGAQGRFTTTVDVAGTARGTPHVYVFAGALLALGVVLMCGVFAARPRA